MNIPAELKYTQDHEWVRVEGNVVTIGVTDFAQGELGDVVFVELPETGSEFSQGDTVVLLPQFTTRGYVEAAARHRVAFLTSVPTMIAMMVGHESFRPERWASMKRITYGASPMPRPVLEEGLRRYGPVFVQYYGQTEAPLCVKPFFLGD